METSDSQLSDVIREGKMDYSPDVSGNRTQDLSQNSWNKAYKAMDNADRSLTPIMSQGTEDVLASEISKAPGINSVFKELLNEQTIETVEQKYDMKFSLDSDHVARQSEQKKRTARIQDFNMDDLNTSIDCFGQDGDSSLMNDETFSNTTLSQKLLGSQKEDYLRYRTPEEQALHDQEKKKKKLAKIEEKMFESSGCEQDAANRMSEIMTQRDPIPMNCADDNEDLFPDHSSDAASEVETARTNKDDEWMKIVIRHKTAKSSDFAHIENKHLWTKINVNVPIELEWKVHPLHNKKSLALRIRFVKYGNRDSIETAIRSSMSNVTKCRNHIEAEQRVPVESFFYVSSSKTSETGQHNGSCFRIELAPGTVRAEFDVIFTCQLKCMGIEDKRREMCLAVFLEDENGNEIVYALIESVKVVGYPRRDCNEFLRKNAEFKFPELKQKSDSSSIPVVTPQFLLSDCQQTYVTSSEVMFNVTNTNQMLPSTYNSRKRGASDYSTERSQIPTHFKTTDYARRLHGCAPNVEAMNFDFHKNENQHSTYIKRIRPTYFPFKTLTLSENEYARVVDFLGREAEEARNNKTSSFRYPKLSNMINHISSNDGIERFLTTLNQGHEAGLFHNLGIHTMTELATAFERDNDIFERMGVDSSKLEKYYELFLNFYRIREKEKLDWTK